MKRSSTFGLRLFTSAFLILFTFAQPLLAIESLTPVQDAATTVDESQDILDEGISDPEEIAKPTWVTSGESATTSSPVVVGEVYTYPINPTVTITFSKLPTVASSLTIKTIYLTDDQVKATNAASNVAYDISTSMIDGTFKYDLTLPKTGENNKVVYAENVSDLTNAKDISNVVENGSLLKMDNLNHFTVFVVTNDPTPLSSTSTPTCVDAGATSNSDCFNSIQDAVTAAADNDTILIKAGTHTLTSQLVISKSLTIVGEDEATTIIVPGFSTGSSGDSRGLILVNNNATVNLSDISIDGNGFNVYQTIRVNNADTFNVSDITIRNISYTQYVGFGIALMDTNGSIENVSMSNIERVGTMVFGNSNYNVDNYKYTGKGNGDWLDYGIELGGGGNANIRNSNISNCRGIASSDGSTSGAIMATTYYGSGTGGNIEYSDFENNSTAILVGYDSSDTSIVKAQYNDFANNDIAVSTTSPQVDARNNSWGTSKESQIQSLIEGNVLYNPWFGKTVEQALIVNEYENSGTYFVKKNSILDFNISGDPIYGQHYIVGLWGYNSSTGSRDSSRYIGWETINPTSTNMNEDLAWNMVTTNWMGSNAPGTIIPAGEYILWVERYYDEGGYVSGSTITKRVTVDDTRPTVSVVSPLNSDTFNGAVQIEVTASDSQTDIDSVSMHIYNAETNALVPGCTTIPTVFDGTNWTTTINNGGSCNLTEGRYRIAAWAYDFVGNPGWAARPEFNIDYTNPSGTLDGIFYTVGSNNYTINNFETNSNSPMFAGTYSDNIGVAKITLSLAGFNVDATLDSGTWKSPVLGPIVADGTYPLTLTITDLAGNTYELTQNIVIDTKAPTAVYTHYNDGIEVLGAQAFVQNVSQLTFTGTYTDPTPSSELYWDSFVIFQAQDDGSFAFAQNGKLSYCSWRQAPNLVTLSGNPFTLTTQTQFTDCVATLPEGTYYMTHQVYDNATRKDIPSINQFRDVLGLKFTVDTTAPESQFAPNITEQYNNSEIALQGSTADLNGVTEVSLYFKASGTADDWTWFETISNSPSNSTLFAWATTWTPEYQGTYDIKASGTDIAGNVEGSAIMTGITFDTTLPTIGNVNIIVDYLSQYVNGRTGFFMFVPVSDSLSGIDTTSCMYTLDGATWNNGEPVGNRCRFGVSSSQLFDNDGLEISAKVSDNAGNTVISNIVERMVDKALPTSQTIIDEIYYGPLSLPEIKGTATDTVSNVTNVALSLRRNSDGKYWVAGNLWMNISTPLHGTSGTDNWTYTQSLPTLRNNVTYTVTPYAWDQVHIAAQAGTPDAFIWDNELPQDPNSFRAYPDVNVPTNDNTVEIYFSGENDSMSGVAGFYYSFSNVQETPDLTNWLTYEEHYAISKPLADGTWYFNIRTIDNAGNITATNHYGPFIIDTTPATISWNTPLDGSIHNSAVVLSATSNETMNNFRFLWKEAGDFSWTQGPNNNNPQTTYEYTFDPIVDGVYTLRAQGRDLAINWSKASPDIEITVDRTAPRTPDKLKFTNPDLLCGGITNSSTVTTVWDDNGDNLTGVKEFIYSVDTPGIMGWTTRVSTTQRLGQFNQGEGVYTFKVKAVDNAGNEGEWSDPCSVTYDATAPDVEITAPTSTHLTGIVEVRGTVTDANPHHYWFVITNSSGTKVAGLNTVNDTTSFTDKLLLNWDTTSLPEGNYTIKLEARDSANNKDSGSVQWLIVTVDHTQPTVDLQLNVNDHGFEAIYSEDVNQADAENPANYFLNNWPTASGTGDLLGDATIIYDSLTHTATVTFTDGGWYISPEQQWGVENIHDLAGNILAVTPYTEYSTPMADPVTSVLGIDSDWHNSDVTVTLTCADIDGSGCYKTYSSLNGNGYVEGNTVIISDEGLNTITFYSEDMAGNVEAVQTSDEVKIDKTDPEAQVLGTTTFTTGDTTLRSLALSDNTELSQVCYVIDTNTQTCLPIFGTGYSWDITSLINTLSVGTHIFTYYVVDTAGNRSDSNTIVEGNDPYAASVVVAAVPQQEQVRGAATVATLTPEAVQGEQTTEEETTSPVVAQEEVKGAEDTTQEETTKKPIPWWVYVLGGTTLLSFIIFLIARRRKEEEDKEKNIK